LSGALEFQTRGGQYFLLHPGDMQLRSSRRLSNGECPTGANQRHYQSEWKCLPRRPERHLGPWQTCWREPTVVSGMTRPTVQVSLTRYER
jgi:hypothetical protein